MSLVTGLSMLNWMPWSSYLTVEPEVNAGSVAKLLYEATVSVSSLPMIEWAAIAASVSS